MAIVARIGPLVHNANNHYRKCVSWCYYPHGWPQLTHNFPGLDVRPDGLNSQTRLGSAFCTLLQIPKFNCYRLLLPLAMCRHIVASILCTVTLFLCFVPMLLKASNLLLPMPFYKLR